MKNEKKHSLDIHSIKSTDIKVKQSELPVNPVLNCTFLSILYINLKKVKHFCNYFRIFFLCVTNNVI